MYFFIFFPPIFFFENTTCKKGENATAKKPRSTSSFLKFYFFPDYTSFFDKMQEKFCG